MTAVDLAAAPAHDEHSCPAHPDATRRRALLGMAVAVGAVCAGCSSSNSKSSSAASGTQSSSAGSAGGGTGTAPGTSSGSDTGSAASSASSSASTGSASGSSSGSSGTGGAALAATSAVPVGGGTILSDQAIVLTQPTAGTFKAFTAICTHNGCTVASIENGLIVCPCHGSRYHIADGSVANGPAPLPLAPIAIKVSGGEITKA